ncbi:MAG TPA: amylo-alpha-1,6-glucosidase, partial [Candidatus Methylomirabilis sp.]|nr:amylo-alpha-1,6-glucosidase [Candidatus Methylomirabilis sp.]
MLPPRVEEERVIHSYLGLDGILRRTFIEISPSPNELNPNQAVSRLKLGPHQAEDFYLMVSCDLPDEPARTSVFDQALGEIRKWYNRVDEAACIVETSNEQFSEMMGRARADLNMMITETSQGLYPYAGIPWFNTVFGRDGIITALETLWLNPDLARGVLNYLAAEQATDLIPEQDAEPGKILHEERKGEMAATGEVPFGKYYGTVDATPLFIVLAGYYYERTGDLEFIRTLWPEIEGALHWIAIYGDADKDGFVEYARRATDGLSNQGWKDSGDSIFHADGASAQPPIALCEVQGYVYEAKMKAGQMASALGKKELSDTLFHEAAVLRDKFVKTFWCPDLGLYALALDGEKRLCRVRTSNPGHCLFSGIADEKHARMIVQNLLGEKFFTGWGVRTVASSEIRYNPMSYHNGSVWPHDNALVAFGMARYRFKEAAARVLAGFFDATLFLDLHRPPELFCGFDRSRGEGPTL